MLKRFEVTNYKKFKDTLVLDMSKVGGYQFNKECIIDDMIGKMIIYGKNASGKTCIGRALLDIYQIAGLGRALADEYLLNASSDEEYAQFAYTFQFGSEEVKYCYKRLDINFLQDEEIYVNKKRVFYYDYITGKSEVQNIEVLGISSNIAEHFFVNKQNVAITQEIVQVPFLRWINMNTLVSDDALIKKLFIFASRVSVQGVNLLNVVRARKSDIYMYLSKENLVDDFEEFLNSCSVKVKLRLVTDPSGTPELFAEYDNKMLPFMDTASSGTLALTNFYYRFANKKTKPSFIFFDEFDAFLHYELSDGIVKFMKKKYPNTQVIFTTHDTNLMSNHIMRPDCLFILSLDGRLTALCDATQRELREGHNLEKMYISGEFSRYE